MNSERWKCHIRTLLDSAAESASTATIKTKVGVEIVHVWVVCISVSVRCAAQFDFRKVFKNLPNGTGF